MSNLIGQSLGRYHILEQLGEGGMAIVYKAYDTRLERDVAVKVIRTEKLTIETMGKTLKRFEREAKALAKLTHPNIVPITDYGEHEEKPYLVMPYLPGGTLKQKLGKPIPWEDSVRLLIPIARALHYAHQQGIIHRDVKPSNILITQSGEPMLTDFGIAKILLDTEETADLTGTGMGVGTPEYMSPEQFQGKGVDARTDVYSLGVVLYEMITGRKPYQADTPAAVLIKQATEPLPRPRSFVAELPDPVEKMLLKILSKEKENRYESMDLLVSALGDIFSFQPKGKVDNEKVDETERIKKERTRLTTQEVSQATINYTREPGFQLPFAEQVSQKKGLSKRYFFRKNRIWIWGLVIVFSILFMVLAIPTLSGYKDHLNSKTLEKSTISTVESVNQPTATAQARTNPTATILSNTTDQDSTPTIDIQNADQIVHLLTLTTATTGWAHDIEFSQDGSMIADLGQDYSSVRIWRISDKKLFRNLEITPSGLYGIFDLDFNPDGKTLAGTSGLYVYIWKISDGTITNTLTKPSSSKSLKTFGDVKFSPDGKLIASASGQIIYLWQLADSKLLQTLGGGLGEIINIAFDSDGQTLASYSWINTSNVQFWNTVTGSSEKLLKIDPNNISLMTFSPDLAILASGSNKDNNIRIWDALDGKLINTLLGHNATISSLVFSPDGLIVASSSKDGEIRLWQVSNGKLIKVLEGHTDLVVDLAFSPDEKLLASVSIDGTTIIWGIAP